ncbi:MAG TPA: DNA mismatch repair endonuclease MutH [Myxococcales bacterium]|jgi:DNA mismatch repair protein MutH|nr:DNA mismatch repair endonuclease MutH [Myxococcales bacterium]
MVAPPRDESELRARLGGLAGRKLGDIAALQGVPVPESLSRNKGWVGQLLERALGATAGSRAEPDFPHLGIELKTIPIDARWRPMESCFVASLDLAAVDLRWDTSAVRKKLARVMWVAVEADPGLPLGQRRFGASILWSPSQEEQQALRNDYEDIVELLAEGVTVRGDRGIVLQLRPKGRDGADLRRALNEEGALALAAPRAFYLRRSFTAALLDRHFAPQ